MKLLLSPAAIALFGLSAAGCGGQNDSGHDPPSVAVQQQAIVAVDSAGVQHHGLMLTTDSLAQVSPLGEHVVPIVGERDVSSVADFDVRVGTATENLLKLADETGEGGTAFVFEEPSIVGVQFSLGQERPLPGDPTQGVHPESSSQSFPFAMSVSPTNFRAVALSSNLFCSAGASAFSTLVACASGSGAEVELFRSGTIAREASVACPPFGWGPLVATDVPNAFYNVVMLFGGGTYVYTSGYLNCFSF